MRRGRIRPTGSPRPDRSPLPVTARKAQVATPCSVGCANSSKMYTKRFPLLRICHANYNFDDRCRSFANSADLHRQEHRATHLFWTMFGAKDGDRATSFNSSGSSAFEPFERLIEAGGTESLMADTMDSLDPKPVAGKIVGDIIVAPNCAAFLATVICCGALNGYALMGRLTPYADRLGERIASAEFSLLNRPTDRRFPDGSDFDDYGISTCNVDVIRNRVFENFLIQANPFSVGLTRAKESIRLRGQPNSSGNLLRLRAALFIRAVA